LKDLNKNVADSHTQAVAAATQAQTALVTAQTAQKQLELSERPWIGLTKPITITKPLRFDAKGAAISFDVTVKNVGNSVANKTDAVLSLMFTDNVQAVLVQQNRICAETPFRERDIGFLVLPSQEFTKTFAAAKATWNEIRVDAAGNTLLWVVGCINYWDTIQEKVRQTRICQSFNNTRAFKPHGVVQGTFTPFLLGESGD
jgi:hypothetical protein